MVIAVHIVACIVIAPAAREPPPPAPVVMVWRLDGGTGVDEQTLTSMSGVVTSQVERYARGGVVAEEDVLAMIEEDQQRQLCGASDTSCTAEVGAALGVPEAVRGDLGRLGDYWVLNLRRIDLRASTVLKRVSRNIRGDTNALIEAIPEAVAALYDSAVRPISSGPGVAMRAEDAPMPWRSIATWSGIGVAVIVGGGGLVLGAKYGHDYDNRGDGELASYSRRSKLWTGVGIAGLATGAALVTASWLVLDSPNASGPHVRLGVGSRLVLGLDW